MPHDLTPIATRTVRLDPRTLKLLDLNARYMRHETFARLVENIRQDGGLTGNTPFAWRLHDDATRQPLPGKEGENDEQIYEVLSGNHRVKAAIAAGLTEIDVCLTDDYLPPDRRAAIQLSHNAISGEDDPATLKLIYENIADAEMRIYSGLDDKTLKLLDDVTIAPMSEAALQFQTISMTFLPDEAELVAEAFEKARKLASGAKGHWLARWSNYDQAMDSFEIAGQSYGVKNTATALMIVLDIFSRHLTDLRRTAAPEGAARADPDGSRASGYSGRHSRQVAQGAGQTQCC
jgi:hypothetical protein